MLARRALASLSLLAAVAVGAACEIPIVTPGPWAFETLDGDGARPGATTNPVGAGATALVYGGFPHAFYLDDTAGDLRHAWFDGSSWRFEVLDGDGAAPGRTSNPLTGRVAAVGYRGQLHLFYAETVGMSRALRHAWFDPATGWRAERLDGDGLAPGRTTNAVGLDAAALAFRDELHTVYFDETAGDLRHAWYGPSFGWRYETLDGDGVGSHTAGVVGTDASVLLYQDQPHLFYADTTLGDLRHAWYDPRVGWAYEALDGDSLFGGRTTEGVGRFTSALLFQGQPHVFYENFDSNVLRHAWWTGTGWSAETLDGAGGGGGRVLGAVGQHVAARLYLGQPHVWYYRSDGGGSLRHAWYDPAFGWRYETLDGNGSPAGGGRVQADVGRHTAVTLWNGELHLFTQQSGTLLRHGAF